MAMNWPVFFTRLGSAIVFAAVMMCGLLWKDWMFVVLVGVIMVLCLRDYFRLINLIFPETDVRARGISVQIFGALLIILLSIPMFPILGNAEDIHLHDTYFITGKGVLALGSDRYPMLSYPSIWPLLLCFPVFIILVSTLRNKGSIMASLKYLGGIIYIILPCALFIKLYHFSQYFPLILILCIWMNDTMAYIVGSFIGRTPFSKISPKKTWEGTAGGALLTVAGAAIAAHFIPNQSMALYIALALCAAIAGAAGDLFESKLKRMAGVKDSGTLMPGHGGALDRFDSLLVATPFAFCAVYLIQAFP